ncbi:peptide chain release factor 1 [Apilactobacillus kunkeei]|uniref:Peptide chain release factor 1 n=1 Tax=Apilactobacillus kunkeei DSM 12361 = ATCC 700308 TaxID=1423768 RepID=A0A0R1FTP0_9LACO|nr:peptide chain release factor 1 [Apilactobacillus kunkeei]KOY73259.1 Peptide chain release factor 1 [Apilactobacillus kunkeei DSM 12361 = ATCC 700308]KRK25189.1 peptide chain release factor 1 [Apilactobacillus kunkeei DSM 12361 = ATCC 700308]MCK8626283.1 peptide chain release factor 1 [Apilactobacillus kunkeei]MCK8635459.1 peptide chain release factor 1 [Apilactobacillus kunkeei]QYU53500.1 peptide chain release factor 1 [Apilactobacillus kunkeei]
MDEIFEKLQSVVDRYDELNELISDPEVIADTKRFMELSKEEGSLREVVAAYNKYKDVVSQLEDDKAMLAEKLDDDMNEMVKSEISELEPQKAELEEQIKIMLLPKDPNDDKNIIMEIHGAAGGDEGSLFAADLYNMYIRYAESQGWKTSIIDESDTEVGGFKEIAIMIQGENVYSKLKFENGAHRVQRVPSTESAGRIHTSTATVGVMPEAEDVDIDIDPKDIKTDVYRASGAGGQHVNKTSSAVRMTHLPTGIVVAMQDERSQQQNRAKAMQVLKSRVYDYYQQQEEDKYDAERKSAVGTGDRSERIRTYNYPQNRVTDHRIGLTVNKLDKVMNGDLEDIIDALILSDQTEKLEQLKND